MQERQKWVWPRWWAFKTCAFSRYDGLMRLSLEVVWKVIPNAIVASVEATEGGLDFLNKWAWTYTIVSSTILGALAGLSIKVMGSPGDLSDLIMCVHKQGYIPMKKTLPMLFVSLLSIASGASLGPEAPLVAISASVCGWHSMYYFKHDVVMVRKSSIIGMSAALSAFFGAQLGGALFALEVLHTMGMQFFDVAIYAIGSGGMSLAVYRGLRGYTFGAIWDFNAPPQSGATELMLGALIGVIAGGVGLVFRSLFLCMEKGGYHIGLGNFRNTHAPVFLCALGGLCISVLGVLVPPSMFWAEFEIGSIADPSKELAHIWPPGGVFYGLDHYFWESGPMYLLVGVVKLLAIACSVQAGFRGGFIFPLFFAGAAMGRGLLMVVTNLLPEGLVPANPTLVCMCFAAGLNVAATRTPFASPLILTTLSGAPNVAGPALCASLASLFITRKKMLIGSQKDRADLYFIGNSLPGAPIDWEAKGQNGDSVSTVKTEMMASEGSQSDTHPAEISPLFNGDTSQNGHYSAITDAA